MLRLRGSFRDWRKRKWRKKGGRLALENSGQLLWRRTELSDHLHLPKLLQRRKACSLKGGGGGGGYGGGHSFNGAFKGPTLHTPAGKGNPPFSFHLFEGDTVPPLSLPSFQGWFLFTSCTFSLVIPHLC